MVKMHLSTLQKMLYKKGTQRRHTRSILKIFHQDHSSTNPTKKKKRNERISYEDIEQNYDAFDRVVFFFS